MEEFISIVRTHPCLWNPVNPDHRDFHLREQAWQNVVKRYNNTAISTIKAAKTEWKKLRDNHREALKRAKLGQNKLLPAQITTWKYAKAMQFLEPHMKYRVTESIEMEPLSTSTMTTSNSVRSSDHDVSTSEIVEHVKTGSQNKRRCIDSTGNPPPRLRNEQSNDPLDSFFNCVLQSAREMPLWMQTQVKKKIFAVIIEAEECLSHEQFVSREQNDIFHIETEIKTEMSDDNT